MAWSRPYYAYTMMEVELIPDGKKTLMLTQPWRPVFRWSMRKCNGINTLTRAHTSSGPRTTRSKAVAHVGLSHVFADLHLQQHQHLITMGPVLRGL